MSVTSVEKFQIEKNARKSFAKFIQKRAKAGAVDREKICRKYQWFLKEGKSEEEAIALLAEGHDRTEGGVRRILNRFYSVVNPATKALTEAMMLVNIDKLVKDLDEARGQCDAELEGIDRLIDEEVEFYTIKRRESQKDGIVDEQLPILEARKVVEDRRLDLPARFFEAVKAVTQKSKEPLVSINLGDRVSDLSDDDLDRRLDAAKNKKYVEVKIEEVGGEEN